MLEETNSCEFTNRENDLNTSPLSFIPVTIDVEQHTKSTPLDVGTKTTLSKFEVKNKKVNKQVVLDMQYEVLKSQKVMILLKNEKLKLQVAELKERANGRR